MIRIENLQKRFGDFPALHNIDLHIKPGEFIALLGPSGSGKTTLLRIIAGLDFQDSGQVFFNGEDVTERSVAERGVGFVFQSYALFKHMTVAENIAFGLSVKKGKDRPSKAAIRDRAEELLGLVQLPGLGSRYPAQLSGGQRQRVALARAIVREPNAFLMDEPLSNLDAKLRVSTRAQIKNLHHTLKTTTVYVTHDQIEAMTLADRVVVMNKGVVQQVGAPKEIYDRPANTFVAGFIGSPAMNLIPGTISGGVFTGDNIRVAGIASAADGPVTLGFRAEDATVAGSGEITAPLYSLELLGEASMVSMRVAGELVSVKVGKDFTAEIGQPISVVVPPSACHLFDTRTGTRLQREAQRALA